MAYSYLIHWSWITFRDLNCQCLIGYNAFEWNLWCFLRFWVLGLVLLFILHFLLWSFFLVWNWNWWVTDFRKSESCLNKLESTKINSFFFFHDTNLFTRNVIYTWFTPIFMRFREILSNRNLSLFFRVDLVSMIWSERTLPFHFELGEWLYLNKRNRTWSEKKSQSWSDISRRLFVAFY